jgi:mRNA-degrading endonuclease toxin of MazEF toxin-antitoxin module
MKRGDIYLGRFPMAGKGGVKVRRVLLLTDPVGPAPEVLTAYISSAIPPSLLPSDLMLDASQPDSASTNLAQVSLLRLHKLSTLHQRDLLRQLGDLSPTALQQVETRLRTLLNL